MLVVLAIGAILVAVTIPTLQGPMRSYKLNATAQLLMNQLVFARQNALSGSHLVQVRFYLLPDYNQSAGASLGVYRAIQCFSEAAPTASGTIALTPLAKPIFFFSPVIISTNSSPKVSPLLATTPVTPSQSDPTVSIYQKNYQYTNFHFKPDGSTDLSSGTNSITLVLENDKTVTGGLPNNYETLQIDPTIGTVRSFTP